MSPFDSDDDEHKLVIDLDAGFEGPSQSSALPTKRKGLKNMRPSKTQRVVVDDDDVNQESSNVEILHIIDNVNSYTSWTAKKRRKRRGRHLWTKVKKVKNGESSKQAKQQKIGEEANGKNDKENASEKRVCSACRIEFFDRYSFTLHMHEHRTGKRYHQCTICFRLLSTAGSLTRHLRIHSGEKPFACSFCAMRFSAKNNMTRHEKMHKMVKNKSRYTADRLLANSQNHMSVPGSSNQRDGNSRFPVPKEIILTSKHKLPFKCPVCGKGFASINRVKSHMALHPPNPIHCPTCDITYKNFAAYEKHSCSETLAATRSESNTIGFKDLRDIPFSSKQFIYVAKQRCEKKPRDPSSSSFAYECHKCGKAFPSNGALHLHESSHEDNTLCHTCGCDFSSAKLFREHQLKHRLPGEVSNHQGSEDPASKEDFLVLFGLTHKEDVHRIQEKPCDMVEFDSMQYFVHDGCSTEEEDEISENELEDEISENELEDEISVNELEDEISVNELEDEICVNELEDEICVNELEDEICVNELEDEICVNELEDEISVNELEDKVSENDLEDVQPVNSQSPETVIQNLRATSAFIPTAATTDRIFMNGGMITLENHFSLTKFGPLQDEPLNLSFDQPLDLSSRPYNVC